MASLIPGYEYDIFISYRQKDNKYDGWVTEFVENLKRELEATFKEDINVYFDINPHDGLLETHDVEASLKEKIKCLVFIPIISHTYCDPKSFAWEHEFKAFIDYASKDKIGLKVKLPGGNVTNRVLPVRIHDLDAEDIKLCESLLGGYLRGVEFIYREPGVNRSLTPGDDENKNLNKTRYRNQINKVANAVKEIISGLTAGEVISGNEKSGQELPWEESKKVRADGLAGSKKNKLISYVVSGVFILVLLGVYAYPKFLRNGTLGKLRSSGEKISIAVMPFRNMTNDSTWNIWQNAIQESLITSLSNTGELRVRNKGNIDVLLKKKQQDEYASLTPEIAGSVSGKLDADVYIYGNILKSGSKVRLDAKLIDTKTGDILKTFEINGPFDDNAVFTLTDTLRNKLTDFLLVSKLVKENPGMQHNFPLPKSADALKYLLNGGDAMARGDVDESRRCYNMALAIDSNFFGASFMLENSYGGTEESYKWLIRNFKRRDRMSLADRYYASWSYEFSFGPESEQIKYLQLLRELDDQDQASTYLLGFIYLIHKQWDKAIIEFQKYFEIIHKWGNEYLKYNYVYGMLGRAYHNMGQFNKERMVYNESDKYSPDYDLIFYRKAILAFSEKDSVLAKNYIEKFITKSRENSAPEVEIISNLGDLFAEAGMFDRAEENYRNAIALDPENMKRWEGLTNFFIENSRKLDEAVKLMDKSMRLAKNKVDYYNYMNTKGWALYKQGKSKEALEVLQKAWDEAPYKLYAIKSHYEEVKKAVESKI
jgi:tetratricopeptide (TPR) repeat protein/TolB-like protein